MANGDTLSPEQLIDLYRHLRRCRLTEERLIALYRQGKVVGGVYTSTGQEALSVGAAYALEDGDILAHTHRDAGALLVRGVTIKSFLSQWLGRATGPTRGRDGNLCFGDLRRGVMGLTCHMGSNLPLAVGAALACKIRDEPRVVLATFGDGAASEGATHEAMNLAAVRRLGVIFVCNNNQFAYSTPLHLQMAVSGVADRAQGYGMPGVVVDGNDVLAVYGAVRQAVERARGGAGPSLVECKTMRMRGHSEADRAGYVPVELLQEWSKRDPIQRYARHLEEQGVLVAAGRQAIDAELRAEVDAAAQEALAEPEPDPASLLHGIYAHAVELQGGRC